MFTATHLKQLIGTACDCRVLLLHLPPPVEILNVSQIQRLSGGIRHGSMLCRRLGVLPPISADCHAALPWLDLHRGREAVKAFLASQPGGHMRLGPREVISEGNKGAAFGGFRLHALSTGRTTDISYSIRFELRDGLIAKYHFLENTFDVATVFRSKGEWLLETDGKRRVPSIGRWRSNHWDSCGDLIMGAVLRSGKPVDVAFEIAGRTVSLDASANPVVWIPNQSGGNIVQVDRFDSGVPNSPREFQRAWDLANQKVIIWQPDFSHLQNKMVVIDKAGLPAVVSYTSKAPAGSSRKLYANSAGE